LYFSDLDPSGERRWVIICFRVALRQRLIVPNVDKIHGSHSLEWLAVSVRNAIQVTLWVLELLRFEFPTRRNVTNSEKVHPPRFYVKRSDRLHLAHIKAVDRQ